VHLLKSREHLESLGLHSSSFPTLEGASRSSTNTARLRTLLRLQVARLHRASYWGDIRHAVGVKAGVPAEKLDALDAYEDCPLFSERERAALAFAEEVTRAEGHVSDPCFRHLRMQFSEAGALELMFVIGYQIFGNRFANAFRLAPRGFS
jgi:alkylhydroperoxidase family enzyme